MSDEEVIVIILIVVSGLIGIAIGITINKFWL